MRGAPPDDPAPLARQMAGAFPDELREEEERLARLRAAVP